MKKLNLIIAIFIAISTAYAQKLPTVQKASVFAPANIKIDGKADEWNNQFQAYNNATDIYYTIANDNENLYFVIRVKYSEVIQKVLMGGITITINHTTKKREENAISVTYPVLRNGDMSMVSNLAVRKLFPRENGDTSKTIKVDDLNQLMDNKSKQINTTGIRSIPDNTISVYNTDGLKAAERFDDKVQYTCEIAIPLKYLTLPDGQPFSYQIKVNEPAPINLSRASGSRLPPPAPIPDSADATTDFWGEYILAKK